MINESFNTVKLGYRAYYTRYTPMRFQVNPLKCTFLHKATIYFYFSSFEFVGAVCLSQL